MKKKRKWKTGLQQNFKKMKNKWKLWFLELFFLHCFIVQGSWFIRSRGQKNKSIISRWETTSSANIKQNDEIAVIEQWPINIINAMKVTQQSSCSVYVRVNANITSSSYYRFEDALVSSGSTRCKDKDVQTLMHYYITDCSSALRSK